MKQCNVDSFPQDVLQLSTCSPPPPGNGHGPGSRTRHGTEHPAAVPGQHHQPSPMCAGQEQVKLSDQVYFDTARPMCQSFVDMTVDAMHDCMATVNQPHGVSHMTHQELLGSLVVGRGQGKQQPSDLRVPVLGWGGSFRGEAALGLLGLGLFLHQSGKSADAAFAPLGFLPPGTAGDRSGSSTSKRPTETSNIERYKHGGHTVKAAAFSSG